MTDSHGPDLVGYLLDALEPAERDHIDARLCREPALRAELDALRHRLSPLNDNLGRIESPPGLAARTCRFVEQRIQDESLLVPGSLMDASSRASSRGAARSAFKFQGGGRESLSPSRGWRWSDALVAVSVCLVGVALLFPLLHSNIASARVAACSNKLRELGLALTDYSEHHSGLLPVAAEKGNLAAAGVCAPTLIDARYLDDSQAVVCPASELASDGEFRVPTVNELENAHGQQLLDIRRKMGGSFGYVLGYRQDGVYRFVRDRRRPQFAIASDLPLNASRAANHGGAGRNVLLEDGRVVYLVGNCCRLSGSDDNIFLNDLGLVAAGCSADDAVVSESETAP